MATVKEQIQECIESNISNLVKMMIILAFWILNRITSAECAAFALQVGYSFDVSARTVSKDADTYTILQVLTMAVDDVYPAKVELGKFVMRIVIKAAKTENYITASDYETLVAKL